MQCICGNSFKVQSYKMSIKESVELCPQCIKASTPTSYVNKEWVQGLCQDDSGSTIVSINSDN